MTEEEKPAEVPKEKSKVEKDRDDLKELAEINNALEKEVQRNEELRAKMQLGGRALAGQPSEKTQEEKDKEEAVKIISMFR